MTETLLTVEGLTIDFYNDNRCIRAVNDLSFSLRKGQTLGLVGHSGCGKTVTALAIAGLLKERNCRVTGSLTGSVTGQDVGKIAVVFQESVAALNPVLTVKTHLLELVRQHSKLDKAGALKRATELLALVGLDSREVMYKFPWELSGGIAQRVCIALALSSEPAILIADEPTSSLDTFTGAVVMGTLNKLVKELGLTMLLISHDLAVVAQNCDRLLIMSKGRLLEEGTTQEILQHPRHPNTAELVDTFRIMETGQQWVEPMVGQGSSYHNLAKNNMSNLEPFLQLKGVTKTFRRKNIWRARETIALNNIDLKVHPGETLGLVGESGSGKTTIGRIVLGLTKPTSGELIYKGQVVRDYTHAYLKEYHKQVTGMFQDTTGTFNPRMTIGQSIMEVVTYHDAAKNARETAVELLRLTRLSDEVFAAYPNELSGGQRQQAALARCLALKPKLLVCDEPLASLDITVQAQLLQVFRELQANKGLAYLFISHDLRAVRYLSHRVAVMYRGYLLEVAPSEVFFDVPAHPYSKMLLQAMPTLDRPGNVPALLENLDEDHEGCPFYARCEKKATLCKTTTPPLRQVTPGHWVKCFEPE